MVVIRNYLFKIMNIYIYGVPGSGKTTLAKMLSTSLGIEYFEADQVRTVAQAGKTSDSDPFCFLPTTEAYTAIGKRSPENVINGLLEVRRALGNFVDREIATREDVIVEAAFLDPERLRTNGRLILLTILAESQHRERFLVHRTEESLSNGQFENARILQDYLITEARRLNIDILSNEGDIGRLLGRLERIVS